MEQFPVQIQVLNEEMPRKLKLYEEEFIGMLIVFLDEQGIDVSRKYQIFKGRSKNALSFEKIFKIISPYILSWYPETGEKELTVESKDQNMEQTCVLKVNDQIHIQFSDAQNFLNGVEIGIQIGNIFLYHEIEDIIEFDTVYTPVFKIYEKSIRKKRNIRRYTIVSGKRRRTILTPKSKKEPSIFKDFKPLHIIEKETENIILEPKQIIKKKPKKKKSLAVPPKQKFMLTPSTLTSSLPSKIST